MARNKYPEETVEKILDVAERLLVEPGYEREPLPEEPGGEERVLRLVEEAFDRKRRAA